MSNRDFGNNRERQDRDWNQREVWDRGDRNPSQGFTGGYGGAFGDRYAEASDRIDNRYDSDANRPSFAGLGPRNYRRSDQRIEEDVNDALMRHHDLDASDIEVRVQNGEVTLSGEVEDRRMKRLAEDITERVMGVRDVHNEIKARRGFWDNVLGGNDDDADRDRERNREQNRKLNERAASRERATTTASTRNGTTSKETAGSHR